MYFDLKVEVLHFYLRWIGNDRKEKTQKIALIVQIYNVIKSYYFSTLAFLFIQSILLAVCVFVPWI